MECDICKKEAVVQEPFHCASCARTSIYLNRIELARTLLENEHLSKEVARIVDDHNEDGAVDSTAVHARGLWQQEVLSARKHATDARIDEIATHVSRAKDEVAQLKLEIAAQKQKNASRRATLDAVEKTIPSRRETSLKTMTEVREKGMTSFNLVSNRSVATRAFLCRETATLLGLRQKKKQRNGDVVEQYTIGGLVLPDLKEINNIRCTDLTASLTSTAHLLSLAAFYLGIRLPAEITNPHRDYPLPTINTPAQSYLGHKISFPGSGSISTAPSSPFSSKHDIKSPYRPRPLFIGSDDREEKVVQFARRDPTAFSFFIEGVSLLAWNVAWLCRSQGFSQGTTSWEEICNIGRNLHQLILGQPHSAALLRVLSSREAQRRQKSNSGTSTPSHDGNTLSFGRLGQASHLSANAFLGQASFNEQSRSWKYSKYNTIADGLKKLLVTEMNNAEWELLQEQEWDDGGEQFDDAEMIKTRAMDGRDFEDARNIAGSRTPPREGTQQSESERDKGKARGKSGWTKVKSRNES